MSWDGVSVNIDVTAGRGGPNCLGGLVGTPPSTIEGGPIDCVVVSWARIGRHTMPLQLAQWAVAAYQVLSAPEWDGLGTEFTDRRLTMIRGHNMTLFNMANTRGYDATRLETAPTHYLTSAPLTSLTQVASSPPSPAAFRPQLTPNIFFAKWSGRLPLSRGYRVSVPEDTKTLSLHSPRYVSNLRRTYARLTSLFLFLRH